MIQNYTKKWIERGNHCINELDNAYSEHIEWMFESVKRTIAEFHSDIQLGLYCPPSALKKKYDEKENVNVTPIRSRRESNYRTRKRRRTNSVSTTPLVEISQNQILQSKKPEIIEKKIALNDDQNNEDEQKTTKKRKIKQTVQKEEKKPETKDVTEPKEEKKTIESPPKSEPPKEEQTNEQKPKRSTTQIRERKKRPMRKRRTRVKLHQDPPEQTNPTEEPKQQNEVIQKEAKPVQNEQKDDVPKVNTEEIEEKTKKEDVVMKDEVSQQNEEGKNCPSMEVSKKEMPSTVEEVVDEKIGITSEKSEPKQEQTKLPENTEHFEEKKEPEIHDVPMNTEEVKLPEVKEKPSPTVDNEVSNERELNTNQEDLMKGVIETDNQDSEVEQPNFDISLDDIPMQEEVTNEEKTTSPTVQFSPLPDNITTPYKTPVDSIKQIDPVHTPTDQIDIDHTLVNIVGTPLDMAFSRNIRQKSSSKMSMPKVQKEVSPKEVSPKDSPKYSPKDSPIQEVLSKRFSMEKTEIQQMSPIKKDQQIRLSEKPMEKPIIEEKPKTIEIQENKPVKNDSDFTSYTSLQDRSIDDTLMSPVKMHNILSMVKALQEDNDDTFMSPIKMLNTKTPAARLKKSIALLESITTPEMPRPRLKSKEKDSPPKKISPQITEPILSPPPMMTPAIGKQESNNKHEDMTGIVDLNQDFNLIDSPSSKDIPILSPLPENINPIMNNQSFDEMTVPYGLPQTISQLQPTVKQDEPKKEHWMNDSMGVDQFKNLLPKQENQNVQLLPKKLSKENVNTFQPIIMNDVVKKTSIVNEPKRLSTKRSLSKKLSNEKNLIEKRLSNEKRLSREKISLLKKRISTKSVEETEKRKSQENIIKKKTSNVFKETSGLSLFGKQKNSEERRDSKKRKLDQAFEIDAKKQKLTKKSTIGKKLEPLMKSDNIPSNLNTTEDTFIKPVENKAPQRPKPVVKALQKAALAKAEAERKEEDRRKKREELQQRLKEKLKSFKPLEKKVVKPEQKKRKLLKKNAQKNFDMGPPTMLPKKLSQASSSRTSTNSDDSFKTVKSTQSDNSTTSAKSQYSTYQISDYHSDEDEEEEKARRANKKIPSWAQGAPLEELIRRTMLIDPEKIFAPIEPSCDLDEIFYGKGARIKRYRRRGSSANWSKDHFTEMENFEYKKAMGFL